MKGVILAGGTGSRLHPLTKVTNKHLLAVGRYPMIYHSVAKLAEAGLRDIMVVTGTHHMGSVVGTLGSGHSMGLDFTYRVQDAAGGIAQALGLTRRFVDGDRVVVLLGDNIFEESIRPFVERFREQASGARIVLCEVPDPQRYGVGEVRDGRLVGIEEKPAVPKSHLAVTGIYMFDSSVFDIIDTLVPSQRGELEITDVNNAYLRAGQLQHEIMEGWWTDAGTFPSLALANHLASSLTLPLFATGNGGSV